MQALSKLTSFIKFMKIDSESFRELQRTPVDDIDKLIQKLQLVKNISELMQALSQSVWPLESFRELR